MELNQIYGISKYIDRINDYVDNLKYNTINEVTKNIIIHNTTEYQCDVDNLLEFLHEKLKENKAISGVRQTLDLDDGAEISEVAQESDFIVLYSNKKHRNIDCMRNDIIRFIKNNPDKTVALVDNSDEKRINEIRAVFGDYFTFYFEVADATNKEKEIMIESILKKHNITFSDEAMFQNLLQIPFYELKSTLLHLIIRCRRNNVSKLEDAFNDFYNSDLFTDIKKIKGESKENMGFDSVIGMKSVKEHVEDIINYVEHCKTLNLKMPSMHMAFLGPPGVGKTSTARIIANELKKRGLLSKGTYIELNARDLIGKFVGSTALKTKEIINNAKGGVIFLDESYSLNSRWENGYEDEALSVLIQEMENNRDDLVVIFAGYTEPMQAFINRNPGLKSRIPFIINFDNYSSKELYQIFEKMVTDSGYKLTKTVKPMLIDYFDSIRDNDDFANGRECRNLMEKARIIQAKRVMNCNCNESTLIKKCDIEKAISRQFMVYTTKTIGFKVK